MQDRNIVVAWVLREHYGSDLKKAARLTGFSLQQLSQWESGEHTPHKSNVSRLMHHAFEPAFTIIAEFRPITHNGTVAGVHAQLATILRGFHKASGVYAFYDSSGNLLYLGKANRRLLIESYTQIKAKTGVSSLMRNLPQVASRLDVVRYYSAYRVNDSEFEDYAKHVEALILRLRKPPLNTNSGSLPKATSSDD